MAYNTKEIVKDSAGNPISQYYNPDTDKYEPVEGSGGGNKVVVYNADGTENNNIISLVPILDKLSQLTGTVIDEETRKDNEIDRIALYDELLIELTRISEITEQVPQSVLDAVSNLSSKIGELQELDTLEKGNLVIAVNEIRQDVLDVNSSLVAHEAESMTYGTLVTRDMTLGGVQFVSLPFKAKHIICFAHVNATKQESYGFWGENNYQRVMGKRADIDVNLGALGFVWLRPTDGDRFLGTVQNVRDAGFDINWERTGAPVGTASLYIIAMTHGRV